MHAAYFRPGGVYRDLPDTMAAIQGQQGAQCQGVAELNQNRQGSLLDFIDDFTQRFPPCWRNTTLLTDNRSGSSTVNIGVVTPERALNLGFTGPMLRGSGIAWDLRKKQPYDVYGQAGFRYPRGQDR